MVMDGDRGEARAAEAAAAMDMAATAAEDLFSSAALVAAACSA